MIIYCFSINKRGKYMASKHWKIISARYRISEEDLGFAPVVGEIELENENGKKLSILTMNSMECPRS